MYTTPETRSNLDIFPGTLDLKIRDWLMTGGDTGSISTIFWDWNRNLVWTFLKPEPVEIVLSSFNQFILVLVWSTFIVGYILGQAQ